MSKQRAERTLLWAQREGITELEGRRGPRVRKRVEKTTSWWGAEAPPTTSNAEQLETRRKPSIPKIGSRGVLGRKSPTPLAPTQKIQWGKRLIPLNPLVAALSSLSHPTERRQVVVYVALGDLPVDFRWSSWQRRTCPCVVLSSVEKRRESRLKARDVRLQRQRVATPRPHRAHRISSRQLEAHPCVV